MSVELEKYYNLETPCYIINREDYDQNIQNFMKAFGSRWQGKVLYGYSVKTNHFPYMLKVAKEHGWYAEVVSNDEYQMALRCGYDTSNIIYNGPQKGKTVIEACKNNSIINIDNLGEAYTLCEGLAQIAPDDKKNLMIGLRVNFDLEEACPGETTSGNRVGRFGLCYENGDLEKAICILNEHDFSISGLHMHQSSSSRSVAIYKTLANKAADIVKDYSLTKIQYIDIGGGFFGGNFFPNKPTYEEYAEAICDTLQEKLTILPTTPTLILEPGAAVLATSMDYLVSVLNLRDVRGERVVTVDGSVTHINPFMHPHETPFTLLKAGAITNRKQIVGGSSCMELDEFFPRNLENELTLDSKLLFHCCGAYMSTHNSAFINVAPNIYVKEKGEMHLLRKRNMDQMMEY